MIHPKSPLLVSLGADPGFSGSPREYFNSYGQTTISPRDLHTGEMFPFDSPHARKTIILTKGVGGGLYRY
jgi:hypothetical protein